MKKQKLKLGLNKKNISNLSSIRGGNDPETVSCTCPVITDPDYTEACNNTQLTTCHGDTSRNCTQVTHCLCG